MNFPTGTAAALGLRACAQCLTTVAPEHQHCTLCGRRVHLRNPHSLQKTIAFLITAMVLYVPANTLPIMITTELGTRLESTIVEGVILLWQHGSYPTAIIVFVASVFVPVAKILSLFWLSWTVARRSPYSLHERERLYRMTEYIGRWSMVDVFVVALLVALVQITGILEVAPGSAALAFCGVVVFTMLAADAFDSRLIWDHE